MRKYRFTGKTDIKSRFFQPPGKDPGFFYLLIQENYFIIPFKELLMKKLLLLLLCSLSLLSAESTIEHTDLFGLQTAYYFDNNRGGDSDSALVWPSYTPIEAPDSYPLINSFGAEDEGRDLGTGWGGAEFQASYEHRIKIPLLTGAGALTKGNNLLVTLKTNLAPVVAEAEFKAKLTPIAFLNFETGYTIGTGWTMGFNGLGLNNDGTGIAETDPFPGVVSVLWLAGTFQFDLASVLPGEWNHVVTSVTAKFRYQNFSAADEDDPWLYKADAGENFNGYQYYGTYVLGYQMPLKINFVGFMVETQQYLGDAADMSPMSEDGGWGSDFVKTRLGPLANFALSESDSLTVLFQMRTQKRYTEETIHDAFFMTREYDSTYTKLDRIALSYTHRF